MDRQRYPRNQIAVKKVPLQGKGTVLRGSPFFYTSCVGKPKRKKRNIIWSWFLPGAFGVFGGIPLLEGIERGNLRPDIPHVAVYIGLLVGFVALAALGWSLDKRSWKD